MNAPDGNTLAAAEHAISLLFALARHIPRADAGMKAGQWPKAGLTGFELEGKRLGVIGLGRIGGTVARKAAGHRHGSRRATIRSCRPPPPARAACR